MPDPILEQSGAELNAPANPPASPVPPPAAAADGTAPAADPPAGEVPEWAVRRFGELTAARKAAEDRAAAMERQLAELQRPQPAAGGEPPSNPNAQVLIEQLAQDRAQALFQQQNMLQRVQSIETAGKQQFGADFDRSVQNLQMAGIGSPQFLEALTNVPAPEKLVRYLGSAENLDEALRIAQLPPVQMAVEMMKLSGKAGAALGKSVSGAPAPIAPIDGSGAVEGAEPDPTDHKAWIAWRNKNARRK